jgi:hypothetical protein
MEQNDKSNTLLPAVIFCVLIALAIIAIGVYFGKIIKRYSRSYLMAYSWLIFYFGFLLIGLSLGESDAGESGFQALSREYFFGVEPILVLPLALTFFLSFTYLIYIRLDIYSKEVIKIEKEDQIKRSKMTGGLLSKMFVICGAGFFGASVGYKVGRNL